MIYVAVQFTGSTNTRTYTYSSEFDLELEQDVLVETPDGLKEAIVKEIHESNPLPSHIQLKKVVDKRSKDSANV